MAQAGIDQASLDILQERYHTLMVQRGQLRNWLKAFENLVPYDAVNVMKEDDDLLEKWMSEIGTIENFFFKYPPVGVNRMKLKVEMLCSIVRRYRKVYVTYKKMHKEMCDKLLQQHGEEGFAHLKETTDYLTLPET